MTTQTEALKLALDGGGLYEITGRIEDIDKCIVHRSVIKETLAQPEQEPVAYLVTGPYEKTAFSDIGSANAYCRGLNKGFDTDAYIVSPLYTTPPQRKPLTNAELFKEWEENTSCDMPDTFEQFKHTARSIEAAHGIKE